MGQQSFTGLGGGVGPLVYQTSRHGVTVRQRTQPTNPETPRQVEARQLLASLSRSWTGLSEAERLAWQAMADATAAVSGLGTLSGHQLYIKLNANRYNFGDAIAPLPSPRPEFGIFTVAISECTSAGLKVTVSNTTPESNLVVWATRPVSQGVSRAFPKAVWMKAVPTAQSPAEIDIFAEYAARFGAPLVGLRLMVEVYEYANGWLSTPQNALANIVPVAP